MDILKFVTYKKIRHLTILFILFQGFIFSQTITLVSPNGGELYRNATTQTISWDTSAVIDSVNIFFSTDGGSSWIFLDGPIPDTGSYTWTIPNFNEPDMKVKVSDNASSASDSSSTNFRIIFPQITNSPVKILPLGDSITLDKSSTDTRAGGERKAYRYYLWDSLRTNDYDIDFIGHKVGGQYIFPDIENVGIPGIRSDECHILLTTGYDGFNEVQVTTGNYLDTYNPDIVLIHLGTNQVQNPAILPGVENVVEDIKSFDDADPTKEIWIILAKIINRANQSPTLRTETTTFNNNLENWALGKINNGYKIIIADMENGAGMDYDTSSIPPYIAGDMFDLLHVNDSGKVKMANLFYEKIQLVLPSPSPSVPEIYSTPISIAYADLPYRYNVDASGVGAPNYSFVSTPPAGMTINTISGEIAWTPAITDTGTHNISVKATNSSGDSPNQDFIITVSPTPTLTNNLISYWKFDETDTSATFEDLPGINNGNCTDCPTPTPGIVGNALIFDNNQVDVLDDSSQYIATNENFSIELWVKTTQNPGGEEKVFFGKFRGSTQTQMRYRLGMDATGGAFFRVKSDGPSSTIELTVSGTAPINNGKWHHVVAVFRRTSGTTAACSLYVDNIRITGSGSPFYDFVSWDPIVLGYFNYDQHFVGKMDEVAFYNRALAPAEIANHYLRGNLGINYFDNFVAAKIKIFLEGPYNTTTDLMTTTLNSPNNYIPSTSPYSSSERTVENIPTSIVDWVNVELRSTANGSTVASRSAFLRSDGMIVGDSGKSQFIGLTAPPGNYYIVVKHRNHLAVMSANTVSLTSDTTTTAFYNFTTDSTKFYGAELGSKKLEDGVWGMVGGNASVTNGVINAGDRSVVFSSLGTINAYSDSDVDLNSVVNAGDRSLTFNNLGSITSVP